MSTQYHLTKSLGVIGACILLAMPALGIRVQEESAPPNEYLGLYSRTVKLSGRPAALTYSPDGWLLMAEHSGGMNYDHEAGLITNGGPWSGEGLGGLAFAENGEELWGSFPWERKVELRSGIGELIRVLSPPAPDSPRNGFLEPRGLTTFKGHVCVVDAGWGRLDIFASDGTWQKSIGEGQLKNPQDVCVDSLGRYLVADTGNSRICAFDAEGNLVTTFGEWGWFPGLFSDPTAIETHGDRFYVADRENQRVQVFDLQGNAIYRIGMHAILPREGEGTLHYPTHLAVRGDGRELALIEPMDGRVQIFGMGEGDAPPKRINRPTDRQPAPHYGTHWDMGAGYLAIPEPETHSIRIYDLRNVEKPKPGQQAGTPTLVTEVGGFGTQLGQYTQPGGVFIGGDPLTLLVCDTGNGRLVETKLALSQEDPLGFTLLAARVQRSLDLAGLNQADERLQRPWTPRPIDVERSADGTTYLLCDLGREIYVLDEFWNLNARFGATQEHPWKHPVAIAWQESTGRLLVCDEGLGRVHVYNRQGQWVSELGKHILNRPSAISFDKQGNVMVIDRGHSSLFTFDDQGALLRQQGHAGIDRDSFFGPTDVDVDEEGRIFILDHGNHRGMVFDSEGKWFHAFGSRLYTKPARLPETIKKDNPEDSE